MSKTFIRQMQGSPTQIFDGKLPREGKGTVQQAWSVGAVLKILLELKNRPKKLSHNSIISITEIKSTIL